MIITIDTNKDTSEDIQKAIYLLKEYTSSETIVTFQTSAKNEISNPVNKTTANETTNIKTNSTFKIQLQQPIEDTDQSHNIKQSTYQIPTTQQEQNNKITNHTPILNDQVFINHTNLMSNYTTQNIPSQTQKHNLPTAMKANIGTPPDFSSYLELLKNSKGTKEQEGMNNDEKN